MHILVVSPIASHPQLQGNSARIFQMCKILQNFGFKVHFLYSQYEGLSASQRTLMGECWDYFYSINASGANTKLRPNASHFGLDDWYDEAISLLIANLHRTWNYRAAIVNYVWLSKALLALPDSVFKVIDAHDVFGDRHIRSLHAGLTPDWFYTSTDEEVRGLQRANLTIAIQEEEQYYYERFGLNTCTIGFLAEPNFLSRRNRLQRPTIGYIGSANPWNVGAIDRFSRIISDSKVSVAFDFVLAGPICGATAAPNFTKMGVIDKVSSFYEAVDVVINPMVGGTGLKIKSIEALSFGKPLISTLDGTVGIPSDDPYHKFRSLEEMVAGLEKLQANPNFIEDLAASSRRTHIGYCLRQLESIEVFSNMLSSIYDGNPLRE